MHTKYIIAPLTNMVKAYTWIDMWARIFPQLLCYLCIIARHNLLEVHCTFCLYSCSYSWHNVINTGACHHDGNSFFIRHNYHCLNIFKDWLKIRCWLQIVALHEVINFILAWVEKCEMKLNKKQITIILNLLHNQNSYPWHEK